MPGFNALQSKPPAPPTALGRLRLLSPNAAIRCSPLLFGGISLGQYLLIPWLNLTKKVRHGTSTSLLPIKTNRLSCLMRMLKQAGTFLTQPMDIV